MKEKRRKKRRIRTGRLAIALFTLLALIIVLILFGPRHEKKSTEEEAPERNYMVDNVELASAGGIAIVHNHIPYDSERRPGEIREIKYIIIHETDNRRRDAGAEAHNTYLTTKEDDLTGWHYTVDDHSIYHNIPDNEISWNAGDKRTRDGGNMNGIAIEMCVDLGNDYEQTLVNTSRLAAELLTTYGLSPDDVRFHADFMDKECPHRLISEGRTEEFLQMIRDEYEKENPSASAESK